MSSNMALCNSVKPLLEATIFDVSFAFNPMALRKAKIAYNFGLSECNRVKPTLFFSAKKKKIDMSSLQDGRVHFGILDKIR